jgi:hypothetical protein
MYDDEYREEANYTKRWIIWIVALFFAIGGVFWFFNRAEHELDKGLSNYEEFQEIYNTTQKINSDLETIRAIPDSDAMFSQFSKQAQIAQKRQQMSRWVEEYNAKSKMWNRSLWKSKELPYQLSVDEFTAYTKEVP